VVVTGPFRSVQRSGRCIVREVRDGGSNPAPGHGAVVIAVRREFVGAGAALLERFLAVALEHQVGGAPDIDLRYHSGKIWTTTRSGLPRSCATIIR
jgi:hypothetical protein